jgi:hypothetical protein
MKIKQWIIINEKGKPYMNEGVVILYKTKMQAIRDINCDWHIPYKILINIDKKSIPKNKCKHDYKKIDWETYKCKKCGILSY